MRVSLSVILLLPPSKNIYIYSYIYRLYSNIILHTHTNGSILIARTWYIICMFNMLQVPLLSIITWWSEEFWTTRPTSENTVLRRHCHFTTSVLSSLLACNCTAKITSSLMDLYAYIILLYISIFHGVYAYLIHVTMID